jgi:predicted AAA+ superfamily ATPase
MDYIVRTVENGIRKTLERGRSLFLFGARQTGKTTLVNRLPATLRVTLAQPEVRQRYEKAPGLLRAEVEALTRGTAAPLVVLDEVQKVPSLLDAIQDLIDRQIARFVLTGSSARKLRRGSEVNLLPGRVGIFRLDPLSLREHHPSSLEETLLYGTLPAVATVPGRTDREDDLSAYVTTYLEEEIRAEAAARNLGTFARFLELAAAEAGAIVNLRRLASDVGVAHTTIASYFQILEDCLVADRVEPLTESATRRRLTRSDKYLIFDLGVRRLAAREGRDILPSRWGQLFEQWVGLELLRWSRMAGPGVRIRFWRDPDGPEVDWIICGEQHLTPIEVKWSEAPTLRDARHLALFLDEYPSAAAAFIVCRTPRKYTIAPRIMAVPWQDLPSIMDDA